MSSVFDRLADPDGEPLTLEEASAAIAVLEGRGELRRDDALSRAGWGYLAHARKEWGHASGADDANRKFHLEVVTKDLRAATRAVALLWP
jgi:hypothetical protein